MTGGSSGSAGAPPSAVAPGWDSTIVAGSRALVDAVLGDGRFEAHEVDEDSDLSWDGDLVNPRRSS